MKYTMSEVLQFINDNDVKFIRLAFCDIFGMQKNISVMPGELARAFEKGIAFDASAISGFMNVEESDLLLFPDPSTLAVLPWRPSHGRVVRFFCDIRHPDGRPFEGDGRHILKKTVSKAAEMGYTCKIGAECEFYLFELDETGRPTMRTHDNAGYCDIAPLDRGENVRREICLTLEQMDILPESSHHEQGPGQNEIAFRYADALETADNLITFKSVVKTIAAQNGLFASFMPKPIADKSGSGLHINLSLAKNGVNIFQPHPGDGPDDAESFTEGILAHVREITAFLNPLTNSYVRLGKQQAPAYVTWSHQNRSQLVRIPAAQGEYRRMELRSPDPSCNPYHAFSLLLAAGLDGIDRALSLRPPMNVNLYLQRPVDVELLPDTLGQALALARASTLVKTVLPARTAEKFLRQKEQENVAYEMAGDKTAYEQETYFPTV